MLRRAKMIMTDANLAPRSMSALFALAKRHGVPVCVNPVSVALAPKLKSRLRDCAIVTPNVAEAEVLTDLAVTDLSDGAKAAQRLVASGVGLAIITMGAEGVVYASGDGSGHVPAVRCDVVDRTGAGDALAAAVVFGIVSGFSVDEALHLGVSAATMALISKDTVNPELSLENLYQALAV
jgi:pseudouridine kinase